MIGGGYLGWKLFVKPERVETLMANAPKEESEPRSRGNVILKSLGYLSSNSPEPKPAIEVAKRESDAAGFDYKKDLAEGSVLGRSEEKNAERLDTQLRKANEDALAARAAGLRDQVSPTDGTTAPKDSADLLLDQELTQEVGEAEEQGSGLDGVARIASRAGSSKIRVDRFGQTGQPSEKSGSDEYYLGKGEVLAVNPPAEAAPGAKPQSPIVAGALAAGGSGSTTAGAAAPESSTLSTVRLGKGRTGGGGGPSSPGPSGPGAPGLAKEPAGAAGVSSAGAVTSGTRGFELNLGEMGDAEAAELREKFLDNLDARTDRLRLLSDLTDSDAAEEEQTPFEQVDRFKEGKQDAARDDRAQRQRRILSPEERQARIEEIIVSCRRLPNEKPRDMFFRFWGDNPYEWTANDRQSTFSMDVDTASYTLARKYLVENHLPEKA
ncbi:MAG: von Willebrand factor type A domain-containing protein, partial [Planctomycetota bacterium]